MSICIKLLCFQRQRTALFRTPLATNALRGSQESHILLEPATESMVQSLSQNVPLSSDATKVIPETPASSMASSTVSKASLEPSSKTQESNKRGEVNKSLTSGETMTMILRGDDDCEELHLETATTESSRKRPRSEQERSFEKKPTVQARVVSENSITLLTQLCTLMIYFIF